MTKSRKGANTVRIIFFVVGLVFLAVGGGITYFTYEFMDNALPATGTVVSVEVNYGDDSVTYKPTIRYIDYNNEKQSGETFLSSSSYNYKVGTKVDIFYDLRDPSSLRMDTWFATWGFGVIFLIGAVVPLTVAYIIGKVTNRNKKPKAVRTSRSRQRTQPDDEEEMIEFEGRVKGLKSRESISDHERETSYTPTVRRNR